MALVLGLVALPVATLAVPALTSVAGANGVALSVGDVLAATGNGLVKHFDSSGSLLDTLDTGTGAEFTTGMCFDSSGDLFVTDFGSDELSKFDSGGNLLSSTWATEPSIPESCTVDASGNVYVGGPGAPIIYEFNSSGTQINSFSVTGGSGTGGTDWVDLSADECTILYTGEGTQILSYNVCTHTQNPDFATGLPGPCYALRIRPNGQVMVACASEVLRLDTSGNILQTYPIAGSSQLFALNLDPDNSTFWTGDIGNGEISHVDIATGNVLSQFNSSPSTDLAGLAVVGEIVVAQQHTAPPNVSAVIQVETSPSYAGNTVIISSSQLQASCTSVSFETLQKGTPSAPTVMANSMPVVLDDDGNVTVVVNGVDCAPGSDVIDASMTSAPFLTALTTLVVAPPQATPAGVTGYPADEVETGNSPASGDSDVYTVFYVETSPTYAEQPVEISSPELVDRCGQGSRWESNAVASPFINSPTATATLDDDGNAAFVFKGASCPAGDSAVIADVEAGSHPTYVTTYTIGAPVVTLAATMKAAAATKKHRHHHGPKGGTGGTGSPPPPMTVTASPNPLIETGAG